MMCAGSRRPRRNDEDELISPGPGGDPRVALGRGSSSSDNQQVAHGFGHGVRAIAGSEFCLRFFEVTADRLFA